jgi:hypothetical protein
MAPSGEVILNYLTPWPGVHRKWSKYVPYSLDGRVVETTNVFPALFGLVPEANPGRAGLERILDGDLHSGCDHFAAVHTTAGRTLEETAISSGVHCRVSNYSSEGRTWLVCSPTVYRLQSFVDRLQQTAADIRVTHKCSPHNSWRAKSIAGERLARNYELIGWCHGALLGAFIHCGIHFDGSHLTEAPPTQTRQRRANELLDKLPSVSRSGSRPLVYLKDPAWEARKRGDKFSAISFAATILQELITHAHGGAVLVVSDHNSEPGRDETLIGSTAIGLYSESRQATATWEQHTHRQMTQAAMFRYIEQAWL